MAWKAGFVPMLSPIDILTKQREIWESKEILKKLYQKWYRIIRGAIKSGLTLEVGGGSGNLKEFLPDTISSDILLATWLDTVLDAHNLPFKNESIDNIVLFDVLHHLMEPAHFFYEAERVLREKGRIVMMEPYISWASFFVYRFFHQEGMMWKINPFKMHCSMEGKNPLHGNQAIPTLIFEKYREQLAENFPHLRIIKIIRMDFVIYPMSGGYNNPSLCPLFLYPVLEYFEKCLFPLSRFLAFRLFVVMEKG